MTRPGIIERSTVSLLVARRGTDAIRASARWRVAASSRGAGIIDQSGASTVLFMSDPRRGGMAGQNAEMITTSCQAQISRSQRFSHIITAPPRSGQGTMRYRYFLLI